MAREPIMMSNLVGRRVLLNLASYDELRAFGIFTNLTYANIVGQDEFGLWVNNPRWEVINDISGNPEMHNVNFLVRWAIIASVMDFPDRWPEGDGKGGSTENAGAIGVVGFGIHGKA